MVFSYLFLFSEDQDSSFRQSDDGILYDIACII